MKSILRSHWVAFPFLVPFVIMLAIHRYLGLSDAVMVRAAPGEREAYLYNALMIAVFYGGVNAFFIHAVWIVPNQRNWVVIAKLAALAVYWVAILVVGEMTSAR